MIFKARNFSFDIGPRTLVMGVINVTPDSFSDGGAFLEPEKALEKVREFREAGVDLIDIGGESTRPGAEPVDTEIELSRVVPILEKILEEDHPPISIDTTKSEVAGACLRLGASIVNDVSGLKGDPAMAAVVAKHEAGIILMHRRGNSKTMQNLAQYGNLVDDILKELQESIDIALKSGISYDQIAVDPGIGFAKTQEQNLFILNRLDRFKSLGRPILVGASRKSFIGQVTGRPPAERIFGTAATVALAVVKGADIVRVHDVKEMRDVVLVTEAILNAKESS